MALNGWIPVSSKLPQRRQDVIVWDEISKTYREDYYSKADGETNGWAYSRQDAVKYWISKQNFNLIIKKSLPHGLL